MKGFRVFHPTKNEYLDPENYAFNCQGDLVRFDRRKGGLYYLCIPKPLTVELKSSAVINGSNVFQGDIIEIIEDGEKYIREVYPHQGVLAIEFDFGDFEVTTIEWAVENWTAMGCKLQILGTIHNEEIAALLEQ